MCERKPASVSSELARRAMFPALFFAVSLCCVAQAMGQMPASQIGEPQRPPAAVGGKLAGQTPPAVLNGAATRISHYEPGQMLRLAVVLAEPHPAAEQQFIEDVHNRQSPLFHQFLSAKEWSARFGPAVADEQAVVEWAQSQGLTVTHRYNNRLVVDLEAPAGVIEKALKVTINHYQLPAGDGLEARMVYSNDRDPSLPAHLVGIVDAVLGLNSIEAARPAGGNGQLVERPDYVPGPVVQELDSLQQDAVSTGADRNGDGSDVSPAVPAPKSGFFKPSDLFASSAYDYLALMNQGHCCNPLNDASGHSPRESSIAIASFGDVSLNDINSFHLAFPYLATNVVKIAIDGTYTCVNTAKSPDVNCVEVTMDTEWSLATANSEGASANTARVTVYEGSTYSNAVIMDVYNQMAADAHARTMTTSWGWGENTQLSSSPEMDTYNSTMLSVHKVLSSMSAQGWTLIAASGDEGATAGCSDALRVVYPSTDPNVLAAGGTKLNFGASATYEVAWTGGQTVGTSAQKGSCASNAGGSTGGFSEFWGPPVYQAGMGFAKRAVPDLSLDTFYGHDVYYNGAWAYQGGTSVAAPMLAGFFAQENAYLLSIGNKCGSKGTTACAPLGNANYPLYEEGTLKNAARSPFYDILSGCNSNDITTEYKLTPFCAGPGYDEVTGWGSANMLQLAWALNWEAIPATGAPFVSFSGATPNKWYNTNQAVQWTIHDYVPTGGTPGTGIAGAEVALDSLPAEPVSEPHGGSGNLFYSGPGIVNKSTGCVGFAAGSCATVSGQGCHTLHVRGWNNQGQSTAGQSGSPETYGPVCFDNVVPTLVIQSNPLAAANGWHTQPTTVSVTATDPGGANASGVATTYYAINNATCTETSLAACLKYTAPMKISAQGVSQVTAFAVDKAGNFTTVASEPIRIDNTPPVTTIALSGTPNGTVWTSAVTVKITATDNLSGVYASYFQLDGGGISEYSGAFTVATPGSHLVKYWSLDVAGNTEATQQLPFFIDSPTTITLTATPNPVVSGKPVTLTASVAAALGATPTGTVTFKSGTTTLGTGALTSGVATLITSALPAGSDSLTAAYGGAAWELPSTSAALTEVVLQTTTTALKSSLNPAAYGAPVTLTATVKGTISGTPTGTVKFFNDVTAFATATLNSSGVATFETSSLALGTNSIFAMYSGDKAYNTSNSSPLAQVVDAAPTTTKVTASANPAALDQSVTFTATLTPLTAGGTVTFKDGATVLGTETLAAGKASFSTVTLAAGAHSITAVYAGAADFLASTSAALVETVTSTAADNPVVYVPDYDGHLLQIRGTGIDVTLTLPSCNPNSVAVNSGKIYVVCNSDSGNPDAILVYPAGANGAPTQTTPSKTITNSDFNSLVGITFDSSNNLWLANGQNDEVDEITAASLVTATPVVTPALGGIPVPEALSFDKDGSLWVTSDFSGGVLYNVSFNAAGQFTTLNSCLTGADIGGNCQYVSGLFTNLQGVALFNGDVWVSNTTYGALGVTPGREIIDLKYSPGTGGVLGTFTVNESFGNYAVPGDSPFVCPSGLFAGTAHLWINDGSYGEANSQCGQNGDAASKAGAIFEFTPAQLAAKVTTASQVLAYTNIAGRPGFGGIFVLNDK